MVQFVAQDDVTLYKIHAHSYRTTFKMKDMVLMCYSGEKYSSKSVKVSDRKCIQVSKIPVKVTDT